MLPLVFLYPSDLMNIASNGRLSCFPKTKVRFTIVVERFLLHTEALQGVLLQKIVSNENEARNCCRNGISSEKRCFFCLFFSKNSIKYLLFDELQIFATEPVRESRRS